MVGHRRDGRSGGPDDGLVGDPLVHLVDDLPRGLQVAELGVEGTDPVRWLAMLFFILLFLYEDLRSWAADRAAG